MSLPTKHKIKSGQWFTDKSGMVFWKEFKDTYGNQFELWEPTSIDGISRSCDFTLIFIRDAIDENSVSGKKKTYWAQDIHAEINSNVSQNIVLRWENGTKKWFLSDLTMLGQTMVCPLESDSCVTVTKGTAYRIDAIQAKKFLDISGFGFGRAEIAANGNLELYVTC